MEIGRNFITEKEMEKYYPKMHKKIYKVSTKKIKKVRTVKPRIDILKKKTIKLIPKVVAKKGRVQRIKNKIGVLKRIHNKETKLTRIQQNDGKLLQQLLFINQRMELMDKDKEKYALVDFVKQEYPFEMSFTIVKIGDTSQLIIKVNENYETQCSCMDWRIRCKSFSVPCKHIYYLLTKILTYELFDYYDNQIMKPDDFNHLVRNRINLGVRFDVNKNDNALIDSTCLICYHDFEKNLNHKEILKCPDCHNYFHPDCMHSWLENSIRRNCPACKSEKWVLLFKNLLPAIKK